MPRKKFAPNCEYPYHIFGRCINREWFKLPLKNVWSIFSNYLYFAHHAFGLRIHSFVLMNNHYHLIAATPRGDLDVIMNYVLREISRSIGNDSKRINQVFGGPYRWTLLNSESAFLNAYKYVYRNPIEAGLSKSAEGYSFSTLPGLLGTQYSLIPLHEDHLLFSSHDTTLAWLNRGYPNKESKEAIRRALRKKEFQFAKNTHMKPQPWETEIL